MATYKHPAADIMSKQRQKEINESTPEQPVEITDDDIAVMNINHVKLGLGSGRFTLRAPADPTVRDPAST